MNQNFSSKILEQSVNEFAKLPGVGQKTALRYVLALLKNSRNDLKKLGETLISLSEEVQFCKVCYNISDTEICDICTSAHRDKSTICVVQDIRDIIAIENTMQYRGLYHVLGGIISPMAGVGPSDLTIDELVSRVEKSEELKEIVFALSTTMEGDTTNFYIYKRISEFGVRTTTLSRGVAFGDELEYTDELTLGRSILNRLPFDGSVF